VPCQQDAHLEKRTVVRESSDKESNGKRKKRQRKKRQEKKARKKEATKKAATNKESTRESSCKVEQWHGKQRQQSMKHERDMSGLQLCVGTPFSSFCSTSA